MPALTRAGTGREFRALSAASSFEEEEQMSTEENKAILRRVCEAYNKGTSTDDVIAPDRAAHRSWPNPPPGAFTVTDVVIEEQLAEGDKVTTRWRATLIQRGEYTTPMGSVVPPSGKRISHTWISIDRIAGGRIVESWTERDWMCVLQQLGAIPTPAPAVT
jgi:predicted ester cyclase